MTAGKLPWHSGGMADELLSPSQMSRADALAVSSRQSLDDLMERAGRAVARAVMQNYKKCPVAVFCGPGNNGGDGLVAARHLAKAKWPVTVYLFGEAEAYRGAAKAAFNKWRGRVSPLSAFSADTQKRGGPKLIVDAIFGAGLNRPMDETCVAAIKTSGLPVVAVDVPSGLDGATGQVLGTCAAAQMTVTFFRKKPGHVLLPGRELCGQVIVADIGIPDTVLEEIRPQLWENTKPHLPDIATTAHKYTRGHAVVWSGPPLSGGAARLAAMAAARVGAGLVSLAGKADALLVQAGHVTSIMLKPVADAAGLSALLADARIKAFCLGPAAGVGAELHSPMMAALQQSCALVLDADALTVGAQQPQAFFTAIAAKPGGGVVLTPHEGEFSRLFPQLADKSSSKVERAITAAKAAGAVVVLKGPDTVIAAPDGRAKINSHAPAKLATAGSGDVLAGIITGLLAQGLEAFEAACAGVWLHGEAGYAVERRSLIAEDLIDALGRE